jgi:DNA-binding GntR family transcriptional regulator
MFQEIAPLSLPERAANALKTAFFSGELKPGDAIVEREIARQMKVGTPVVREALISLQEQGFVRRVANTGTFVTRFSADEVRQLFMLRIELETIAFQWARANVTEADLEELARLVDAMAEAGERSNRREFLERDLNFHRRCWQLSGNAYLADTLDRLMSPLFAFVVVASESPLTGPRAREHNDLIDALRSMKEPEFSLTVRKILTKWAFRWLTAMDQEPSTATTARQKPKTRQRTPTGDPLNAESATSN